MAPSIRREMTEAPISIRAHVPIQEARDVISAWGMRHLPVTDDADRLIGILSDRDFVRLYDSNLSCDKPVSEIMTTNPYWVYPETSLFEVVLEMAEAKIGSAVVVSPSRLVLGIFTTTDAMKILAKMLRDTGGSSYKTIKISDYLDSYQSA